MAAARRGRLLHELYQRLWKVNGPQGWWPGDTPFEVAVGAILTQNTNWKNVTLAIAALKEHEVLEPQALRDLPEAELARLIRPAGYYNIKARRLKNFLDFLANYYRNSMELMAAIVWRTCGQRSWPSRGSVRRRRIVFCSMPWLNPRLSLMPILFGYSVAMTSFLRPTLMKNCGSCSWSICRPRWTCIRNITPYWCAWGRRGAVPNLSVMPAPCRAGRRSKTCPIFGTRVAIHRARKTYYGICRQRRTFSHLVARISPGRDCG